KLDDKVFRDVLALDIGKVASPEVANITLHQLLTHTGGGWGNKLNDPMFKHPEMNHAELINDTLQTRPLDSAPGKAYAYSNFGYCVLGRVIEKITGKPYANYVQEHVLAPCGIKDMQIAGSTLAERAYQEVVYLGQDGQKPYGMNIRRLDSHGGWMATPTALVKFLTHVDGFGGTPDILQPATLTTMTTPTVANPNYASGLAVNAVPNWWHGGSLPGTSSFIARTASGMCWAGVTNSRSTKDPSLDKLMWRMAKAVPAWKA
ncbi:MAG: penicillin-binding protein, partial [Verrucomicrobiaceae bacterium]|nr:penicillin-binding protein [Verrucomicrobiaceae bacterium]